MGRNILTVLSAKPGMEIHACLQPLGPTLCIVWNGWDEGFGSFQKSYITMIGQFTSEGLR